MWIKYGRMHKLTCEKLTLRTRAGEGSKGLKILRKVFMNGPLVVKSYMKS